MRGLGDKAGHVASAIVVLLLLAFVPENEAVLVVRVSVHQMKL